MKTIFTNLFLVLLATLSNVANAQSGNVFNDLNGNGIKDAGEPGVGGIIVKAIKQNETLLSTATTDSLGNYTLPIVATTGQKVRIEFTRPSNMSYLRSSFGGGGNCSAVQFKNGNQSNTNYAVINPAQSVGNDPILAYSRFTFGNQITGDNKDTCVLFGVKNSWGTTSATNGSLQNWQTQSPYRIAFAKEIGSVYGVVYSKKRKALYTSAFFRQFSGFGPNGPGAIYKIPYNSTTGIRTANPSLMVDVTTLAGQTMPTDPHGTDTLKTNRLSSDVRMALTTKYSLGDLEISDDETKIYTVNLYNREIIAINPDNGTLINRWAVPTTGLLNSVGAVNSNDVRPFALGYKNGKLYVGAIATAQSTQTLNNTFSGVTGNTNAMHAYVWELDETNNTFTLVLDFKINTATANTYSWQDSWNNGVRVIQNWGNYVWVPQPILSDIDFYGNDMIIGFRNRSNDQRGVYLYDATIAANAISYSWGDVLGAKYNHLTNNYTLETNGTIGNRIATGNAGVASGYNEFYRGDGLTTAGATDYIENATGAFVQVGGGNLVSLQNFPTFSMNVYPYGDQAGLVWMNNQNGNATKAYASFVGDLWSCPAGKSNGLGAIEAITETIPMEIGNRVWNDADGNGLQSPEEDGYSGITIELLNETMTTVIATAVTNSEGYYLFDKNNVPSGLAPNSTYKLRISTTHFLSGGGLGTLAGTVLTPNSAVTFMGAFGIADNDAIIIDGNAVISFATGALGENDHDLDFGLKSSSVLAVSNITSFTAIKRNANVVLNWATVYEKDLATFEIEQSVNGLSWTKIGTVTASVNSNTRKEYAFTDFTPINAKNNLYRLKQIGTDATHHYSEIRMVKMQGEDIISVFPNPAKDKTTVTIPVNLQNTTLTIKLIAANGQVVQEVAVAKGTTQQSINLNDLNAGMYSVLLTSNKNLTQSVKLQIVK